jgi:hypothetical protein
MYLYNECTYVEEIPQAVCRAFLFPSSSLLELFFTLSSFMITNSGSGVGGSATAIGAY